MRKNTNKNGKDQDHHQPQHPGQILFQLWGFSKTKGWNSDKNKIPSTSGLKSAIMFTYSSRSAWIRCHWPKYTQSCSTLNFITHCVWIVSANVKLFVMSPTLKSTYYKGHNRITLQVFIVFFWSALQKQKKKKSPLQNGRALARLNQWISRIHTFTQVVGVWGVAQVLLPRGQFFSEDPRWEQSGSILLRHVRRHHHTVSRLQENIYIFSPLYIATTVQVIHKN